MTTRRDPSIQNKIFFLDRGELFMGFTATTSPVSTSSPSSTILSMEQSSPSKLAALDTVEILWELIVSYFTLKVYSYVF
jgi:hypothetical protein